MYTNIKIWLDVCRRGTSYIQNGNDSSSDEHKCLLRPVRSYILSLSEHFGMLLEKRAERDIFIRMYPLRTMNEWESCLYCTISWDKMLVEGKF